MFTKRWFLGQAVLWPLGFIVGVLLGAGVWVACEWWVDVGQIMVRGLIG